jgi:DNA-binding transcriptional MerR regulator
MSKALEAFRTISEVADELEVQKHVLRFWENKFPQVRPMKRGGGRRYYRPDDLDLLRGIRFLLHKEGYTIKGVQKLLREQGLDFVKSCWQVPASRAAIAGEISAQKTPRKTRQPPVAAIKQSPALVAGHATAQPPVQPQFNRQEHVVRLKALVAELEECRRILRNTKPQAATTRPERASK